MDDEFMATFNSIVEDCARQCVGIAGMRFAQAAINAMESTPSTETRKRRYVRISEEQREEVLKLRAQGKSAREASRITGVSFANCNNVYTKQSRSERQ